MADSQTKPDTEDIFDKAADFLLGVSFVAAMLWFFGIIGYQAVNWLRFGEWKALPFITAFDYFGLDLDFVYDPQSWIGLARIVQWLLSLPLSLVGALLIVFLASMIKKFISGHDGDRLIR